MQKYSKHCLSELYLFALIHSVSEMIDLLFFIYLILGVKMLAHFNTYLELLVLYFHEITVIYKLYIPLFSLSSPNGCLSLRFSDLFHLYKLKHS